MVIIFKNRHPTKEGVRLLPEPSVFFQVHKMTLKMTRYDFRGSEGQKK